MPQVRVLGKGARITGGLFCLLFLLHTTAFLAYDIVELGVGPAWDLWTGGTGEDLPSVPVTSPHDLGLALLQLFGVWTALNASRAAGGVLAVTTALTLAFRLPVVWHMLFHVEDDPGSAWYAAVSSSDTSLEVAGFSSAWVAVFAVILAIVLLAGRRPWPGAVPPPGPQGGWGAPASQGWGAPASQSWGAPAPQGFPQAAMGQADDDEPLTEDPPSRPAKASAMITAALLGAIALCNLGWNLYVLNDSGVGLWIRLITGKGLLFSILAVAPAWQWLCVAALCGIGAVLALTRRLPARGFALALAAYLLPQAAVALWSYIDAGVLSEIGDDAPGAALLGRVQLVLELLGSVAILALGVRPGEAVAAPVPSPLYGWTQPTPVSAPPPTGQPFGYGGYPAAPPIPPRQQPDYGYGSPAVPQQPGPPPQGTFGAPPVL